MPVVTIPAFDPLTAGYGRNELQTVSVSVANRGAQEIRVLSVALAGENSSRFRLNSGAGAVIGADETRDTLWTITPRPNLAAGTYEASFVLTLKGGEKMSVPFSLTVEEP